VMAPKGGCVQQWAELFRRQGPRPSRVLGGEDVASKGERIVDIRGKALRQLRQRHEREHRTMMKYVGKETYLRGGAKVRHGVGVRARSGS
jgi:hypothetical protein